MMGGDDADPPCLAGQSVRDLRWAFDRTLGADVVARALASLPPEIRDAYAGATPLSWVPYHVVVRAHEAIAREGGTTMEAMLERAVPLAVEHAFTTVWRVLLLFTGDEALIARTPLLYSKTRSKGTMTARLVERGHGLIEVVGWPAIPPRDMRALALSIQTLLRLAGRQEIRVDSEKSPEGVRYVARWRVR